MTGREASHDYETDGTTKGVCTLCGKGPHGHATPGRKATGLPGHFKECPRYVHSDPYFTDWCDCAQRRAGGEVPPIPLETGREATPCGECGGTGLVRVITLEPPDDDERECRSCSGWEATPRWCNDCHSWHVEAGREATDAERVAVAYALLVKGHTPCNREGGMCLLTREHDGSCVTAPARETP